MSYILNILRDCRVVALSHTFEEGMPRPQVPYGHILWKSHARGDAFNTYMFLVFEHAGTHVDAPIHLGGLEGPTVDQISPENWMGPLCVLDMTHKKKKEFVQSQEIKDWEKRYGEIRKDDVVLINYGWERMWTTSNGVEYQPYLRENPGLSEDAARLLVDRGAKMVGADTPTIDSDADPEEHAHRVLLPAGVLVLENACNLGQLPPRGAFFIGLPLKIKEGTGCPVRAVALIPNS